MKAKVFFFEKKKILFSAGHIPCTAFFPLFLRKKMRRTRQSRTSVIPRPPLPLFLQPPGRSSICVRKAGAKKRFDFVKSIRLFLTKKGGRRSQIGLNYVEAGAKKAVKADEKKRRTAFCLSFSGPSLGLEKAGVVCIRCVGAKADCFLFIFFWTKPWSRKVRTQRSAPPPHRGCLFFQKKTSALLRLRRVPGLCPGTRRSRSNPLLHKVDGG